MTNVVTFRPKRTLAHVLLEVRQADEAWRRNWNAEDEGQLLDRLDELRIEAKAMIEAATGVQWASIEASGL